MLPKQKNNLAQTNANKSKQKKKVRHTNHTEDGKEEYDLYVQPTINIYNYQKRFL